MGEEKTTKYALSTSEGNGVYICLVRYIDLKYLGMFSSRTQLSMLIAENKRTKVKQ